MRIGFGCLAVVTSGQAVGSPPTKTTGRHLADSNCEQPQTRAMSSYHGALLLVMFLLLHSALVHGEEASLKAILALAAGVYRNASSIPADISSEMKTQLARTVLVTGSNFGYINHVHNFKCFLDRLDFKAVFIAMDKHVHDYVTTRLSDVYHSHLWLGTAGASSDVHEGATEFRSAQFHVITTRKKEAVLSIMELGYDVIFVDTDIAMIKSPLPYLFWRNVEYVHSHNKICPQSDEWNFYYSEEEGNTGFYFVRSSPRTIKLFQAAIADAPKHPGLDDQTIFWDVMRSKSLTDPKIVALPQCRHFEHNGPVRTSQEPPANYLLKRKKNDYVVEYPGKPSDEKEKEKELVVCPLDGCVFSAGALRGVAYAWLEDNLKNRKNDTVCTVHANYLKGHLKAAALEQHGYWLAVKEGNEHQYSNKCKPYSNRYPFKDK